MSGVLLVSGVLLDARTNGADEKQAVPEASHRSVTAAVDALFAEWDRPGSPGCSVAVSRRDETVYEHGYGMANLELGVPIAPNSAFHVASIAKQFTAMSLVLLAQRGRLSLDDEVRKYVPELPSYGHPLTIRHVLSHTSGLRDAFLLRELTAPRSMGGDGNEALVDLLTRQRGLNFTPGTEFQYSDTGYALLASVVKRVSGQPLAAFAAEHIFAPLAMNETRFYDDPRTLVPNRASGYFRTGSGFGVAVHGDLGHVVGNTGLFTTARDLLRWEQNFARVRVGDPALVAAMQSPAVQTGETTFYGLGLEIKQHRGLRAVGHGGGDPGYAAYVVRYPDQELAVAVLCNLEEIGAVVGKLTQDVAEVYLADAFPASPAATTPVAAGTVPSAAQLASKAGFYRDVANGTFGHFFVRDGKLRSAAGADTDPSGELIAIDENRFVAPGTPVTFEFTHPTGGGPREIHITGAWPRSIVMRQVTAPFAPTTDLRAFQGRYRSEELAVTYTVSLRAGSLILQIPGRADIALRPIFRDAFRGEVVDVVEFARGAGGAVTGLSLHSRGVRTLDFQRARP